MRRLALAAALALLAAALVSCANTPTAPRAMVHLTGTVTNRDGARIQAVYLNFTEIGEYPPPYPYLSFYTPGKFLVHAVTDLNGNYSADVPAGDYWLWIVPPRSTAYMPILLDKTVRAGDKIFDYRFRYARLVFHPTMSGGQSIASAYAAAYPTGEYAAQIWARPVGADLEIFVAPGSYEIQAGVSGPGFGYPIQRRSVPVSADTTIDLAFVGNAVTAHVIGPGGTPLEAYVYTYSPQPDVQVETDASGTAILYLANGGYTFGVEPADRTIQSREYPYISIGSDVSLDFDVDGTHWSGTLRRSSDGAPLPDRFIAVEAIGPDNERAYCRTDANGAFHFVVRPNWGHEILVDSGDLGRFDNVIAGADSTFDLVVPDPPSGSPPAARGIPARTHVPPGPGSSVADRGR